MAEVKKYRLFTGVLYPDSEVYSCTTVLDSLAFCFEEYAFILHDADTLEDGSAKKPHYHWMGKRKNPVTIKTIANSLGVAENYIETIKNGWKKMAQYLIHFNDEDKAQYSPEDVNASFNYMAMFEDNLSSQEQAKCIMAYIVNHGTQSILDLTRWAIDEGFWSEYRRGYGIWKDIVHEMKSEYGGSLNG